MLPNKREKEDFKRGLASYYRDLADFLDDGSAIIFQNRGRLRKLASWHRSTAALKELLRKRIAQLPEPAKKEEPVASTGPAPIPTLVWPGGPLASPYEEATAVWAAYLKHREARLNVIYANSSLLDEATHSKETFEYCELTDTLRRLCASVGFQARLPDETRPAKDVVATEEVGGVLVALPGGVVIVDELASAEGTK